MNLEIMKKTAIPVLKKHGVIKAALFGSWVRGEQSDKSDVDFLVQLEDGQSLLDLVGLEMELEEKIRKKIDLLTYDSLHPKLKDSILREQQVFYESKP